MSEVKYPLINNYNLEVTTPECHPSATLWRARLDIQEDITGVLPYLNGSLTNCEYDHDVKVMLWSDNERKYAFRPHEIVFAPVTDRGEAQTIADNLIGMVNYIWDRRHEVEPNIQGKRLLPNLLDIYRLLPGTNCKECGFATCMAYAADLRKGKTELSVCVYLSGEGRNDLSNIFNAIA